MLIKAANQIKNATQYSIQGVRYLLKSEMAARLEVYLFVLMSILFILLNTPKSNLVYLFILFCILLAIEALNTAVEVVVDKISPEISEVAKNAKDLGSFAVMCVLAAITVFVASVMYRANWGDFFDRMLSPIGRSGLTILFIVMAIYYFVKASLKSKFKWFVLGLCGFLLLGLIAFNAANVFTGAGIDEKVIFHLGVGFGGAGLSEYWELIALSVLSTGITILALWLTSDLLGKAKLGLSKILTSSISWDGQREGQIKKAAGNKRSHFRIAVMFLILAVIVNPISLNLFNLASKNIQEALLESRVEFYVAPQIRELSDKKNVVLIYLEGVERSYMDETRFPGLMSKLPELEKEATSFSDIRDTVGTGWTIAGLVSTQCGVPLYTSGQVNAVSGADQFMPEAVCLGDILNANGYDTVFMGGAKLEFAGKGKFLNSHGFDHVRGKEYFEKVYSDPKAFSWWGLNDAYLYTELLKSAEASYAEDKPFALLGLTLDTHAPDGHATPACEGIKYQDGQSEFLNSVKCADILTYNFIQDLRNLDDFDDTVIIIVSDHLSMQSGEIVKVLRQGARRNILMIIDDDASNDGVIARPGSKYDVGATLLSQLGLGANEWGFGRNLFNDAPTLVEASNGAHNKVVLEAKDILTDRLWKHPNLTKDMQVDFEADRLNLGERSVPLPVIFKLNDEKNVLEALYNNELSPEKLKDFIPVGYKYVWIDKCSIVGAREAELDLTAVNPDSWCLSVGDTEGQALHNQALPETGTLSKKTILSYYP